MKDGLFLRTERMGLRESEDDFRRKQTRQQMELEYQQAQQKSQKEGTSIPERWAKFEEENKKQRYEEFVKVRNETFNILFH